MFFKTSRYIKQPLHFEKSYSYPPFYTGFGIYC